MKIKAHWARRLWGSGQPITRVCYRVWHMNPSFISVNLGVRQRKEYRITAAPHTCWTAIKLTGCRCQLQRLWVRIPAMAWSVHDWGETPEQGTEPPTAPQAPQCRLPIAPLGWVKCREHISLLIILCIIVYVTNKAHLSLIWNTYIFNIL